MAPFSRASHHGDIPNRRERNPHDHGYRNPSGGHLERRRARQPQRPALRARRPEGLRLTRSRHARARRRVVRHLRRRVRRRDGPIGLGQEHAFELHLHHRHRDQREHHLERARHHAAAQPPALKVPPRRPGLHLPRRQPAGHPDRFREHRPGPYHQGREGRCRPREGR